LKEFHRKKGRGCVYSCKYSGVIESELLAISSAIKNAISTKRKEANFEEVLVKGVLIWESY